MLEPQDYKLHCCCQLEHYNQHRHFHFYFLRIQTRNYDAQDGTKRYVTEVIADNVSFLGGRSTSSESSSYAANNYNNVSNTNDSMSSNNFGGSNDIVTTNLSEDPYANMGSEVALSDDDLPF